MTDNELIAEFMGIKPYEDGRYGTMWPDISNNNHLGFGLDFDTSWNWLMPVIQKIYSITPQAFKHDSDIGPISPFATLTIADPIEDVHRAVVLFIKWYNSQKQS